MDAEKIGRTLERLAKIGEDGWYCLRQDNEHFAAMVAFKSGDPYENAQICAACLAELLTAAED